MEGRTVVITGGNAGIGKETAIGLARLGARVIITSRDEQRGARAVAEISARSGSSDVEVLRLDLASFASIRAFAAALLERTDAHQRAREQRRPRSCGSARSPPTVSRRPSA